MTKFLLAITTFLLMLMPWCNGLHNAKNRLTFDESATWSQIKICVENHDVATLESMMRPWFRDNASDLSGQINQMYNAIDGDIVEVEIASSEYSSNDGGIYSVGKLFIIRTDESLYNLKVYFDVTNKKDPRDVGIGWLKLVEGIPDGSGSILLVDIRVL